MRRQLSTFKPTGYDKGRNVLWQVAWLAVSGTIFRSWMCPSKFRVLILRGFGARISSGVLIRHRVRIHWPWKLSIGQNAWIGEGVWILNLEEVSIGSDVCVSQEVFICSGSHKASSSAFEFDNAPIRVEDGVWLCAQSAVLRGVTVGADSVVGARSLVTKNVPPADVVLAPIASRCCATDQSNDHDVRSR